MSRDNPGSTSGDGDDSPSISHHDAADDLNDDSSLINDAAAAVDAVLGGENSDRMVSEEEEEHSGAEDTGIAWTPRWRQQRRRRKHDATHEDEREHEGREGGRMRLLMMRGGIFGLYDRVGGSFRYHLPRRRRRSLSLAAYVAACGVLLFSGQMNRMNGVVVPGTGIRNDNRPYDPWDQGDLFRDRGPRPKRKKIKKVASTKGKDLESAATETVDAHGGKVKERVRTDEHDPLPQLLDWRAPFNETDVPVLWHVPRSAGGALSQVMTRCYGLAIDAAYVPRNGTNATLQVVNLDGGERNINAASVLADVVMTPYLREGAALFAASPVKGRCFALIRHPIDRAVSMFRHLRRVSPDGAFVNLSLSEYARGPWSEENWFVRFLSNRTDDEVLRWSDLELAKDILGRKCFVGLVGRDPHLFLRSVRHFQKAFRWEERGDGNADVQRNCTEAVFCGAMGNALHRSYPTNDEGSEVWDLLLRKNGYDLRLYEHALDLFEEQRIALNVTYERAAIDVADTWIANGTQHTTVAVDATHSFANESAEADAIQPFTHVGSFNNASDSSVARNSTVDDSTSSFTDDAQFARDAASQLAHGTETLVNATDHHINHHLGARNGTATMSLVPADHQLKEENAAQLDGKHITDRPPAHIDDGKRNIIRPDTSPLQVKKR